MDGGKEKTDEESWKGEMKDGIGKGRTSSKRKNLKRRN